MEHQHISMERQQPEPKYRHSDRSYWTACTGGPLEGTMSTSEHDQESEIDSATTTTALADLPPSSKLVYKVLEYEGALTQDEISAESRLCSRTVRYAISKLTDEELVSSRVCLDDARQSKYWVQE